MSKLKFLTSAVIAATVGFSSVAVTADEVADFYKGKRLKMIVGSGAGGGGRGVLHRLAGRVPAGADGGGAAHRAGFGARRPVRKHGQAPARH